MHELLRNVLERCLNPTAADVETLIVIREYLNQPDVRHRLAAELERRVKENNPPLQTTMKEITVGSKPENQITAKVSITTEKPKYDLTDERFRVRVQKWKVAQLEDEYRKVTGREPKPGMSTGEMATEILIEMDRAPVAPEEPDHESHDFGSGERCKNCNVMSRTIAAKNACAAQIDSPADTPEQKEKYFECQICKTVFPEIAALDGKKCPAAGCGSDNIKEAAAPAPVAEISPEGEVRIGPHVGAPDDKPKRKRGRPKKASSGQLDKPARKTKRSTKKSEVVAPADNDNIATKTTTTNDNLTSELQRDIDSLPFEIIRPDYEGDGLTEDYYTDYVYCDNEKCGGDQTVVRVPPEPKQSVPVGYVCMRCMHRGSVNMTPEEVQVIRKADRVDYADLLKENPLVAKEFAERGGKLPENVLNPPTPGEEVMKPPAEPEKQPTYQPDVENTLNTTETDEQSDRIVDEILSESAPNLDVSEDIAKEDLTEIISEWNDEKLVAQWEKFTNRTHPAGPVDSMQRKVMIDTVVNSMFGGGQADE